MGTGGESFHPNPRIMVRTALTAELADAALKPFGLRVTAWSSTKFLVWKGDQNQCKRREAVAELIGVYQSAA